MRGDALIKAQPWEELLRHFRDLAARSAASRAEGVAALIEHIRNTPLGTALYGATAHDQLLLSPQGAFGFEGEVLQVEADPADGAVVFRYASAAGGPRWHRRASAADSAETLERFVRELKWVSLDVTEA